MMKKIENNEYKRILVDLLKYLDQVCRENSISYSPLGGTMIGAIREKGIIPWDDDIDVVLMHDEYEKLITILKTKQDAPYKILDYENTKGYLYPFAKLVDTRTVLNEKDVRQIDDYGIYVDIFEYNYMPNNNILRKIHYYNVYIKKSLCNLSANTKKYKSLHKKIISWYAHFVGTEKLIKRYIKACRKYNKCKTKFIMSNWPAYGYEHEIQKASDFLQFIDVKFEDINIKITRDYDSILKTTFGDYMTPPPEDKRVAHDNEAYWKKS
mgnify:FL=1